MPQRGNQRSGPVRPARRALLLVAVVLALTADDRHAGKVSDGRQMIETAVALVETGGLGLAKGAPRAVERSGDAVSRYGFGTTVAQLPAVLAAPLAERRLGPGTSQPLFLLAPLAAVLLAAAAAGGTARLAGASLPGAAFAVVLAGIGSPLGAYATSDFSEALQAAALGGTLVLALAAARELRPSVSARLAVGAGAAAGFAVLLKSGLAAVSPLLLLPLAAASPLRGRRLVAGTLGAIAPLGVWLVLEIVRFGAPFWGYGGEGFSHPLPDGLWRLLVGPNRGLLVFFPAAALAAIGLRRALAGQNATPVRLAALGSLGAFAVLLVTASSWWAWHGVGGWGPRLLVPAVPLLAPWAALVAERFGRCRRRALLALSVGLNLPPLLLHPTLVDTYAANSRRPLLTPELEKQVPDLAIEPDEAGRPSVPPDQVLATLPSAAPHLVYAWHFATSLAAPPETIAVRLARPPWYESRPDLGPRLVPIPPELASILAPPPRWGFFGRSLLHGTADPVCGSVYLQALAGQILRAHETRRLERGLALAERLSLLRPGDESDALYAESLRLLGRTDTARAYLATLPQERVGSPPVLAVRALLARDRGLTDLASQLGEAAAPWYPGTSLAAHPRTPSTWPGTWAALTRRAEAPIAPGPPGLGKVP